MELKISTNLILKVLHVLSWIIFIGLCIEAGAFLTNAIFALAKPSIVSHLWNQIDLSALFTFNRGYFFTLLFLMCIVSAMKALIFYLIIKLLHDKKLNLAMPFNKEVVSFITNISYLALGIGLFSLWGQKYAAWCVSQGISMPDVQSLQISGGDVWLFMAVTLLVIAKIFKRGIEIQSEHELTI